MRHFMGPISELFKVGDVVGFHGIAGEIKVRPSTNNPELLLDVRDLVIQLPSGEHCPATVGGVRVDRRMLLLRLREYPDRTAAECLRAAQIFVGYDQLRSLAQDEWWVTDLVGLSAYTTDGDLIGKVSAVVDGASQILEIRRENSAEGKSILVPFVKDLVPVVDIRARRIEVVNLPGLLEEQ